MLDAITETGLTAIELAALRKCDSVSFHHHPPSVTDKTNGPANFINATKRNEQSASNPFGPNETTVTIAVNARLTEYTEGAAEKIEYSQRHATGEWRAFDMLHSCQVQEEWKTIAKLLRVGDLLTLAWSRGGFSTQGMKESCPRFVGDSLSLLVERDGKFLAFHVGHYFGEDNTARMVRK